MMIYQDKHLDVKRHEVTHVEGNALLMVGNGEAADGGNLDIFVEKNKNRVDRQGQRSDGGWPVPQKIDGTLSQTVGGDVQIKSGGNIAAESCPAKKST